jgi:hypothetical protein
MPKKEKLYACIQKINKRRPIQRNATNEAGAIFVETVFFTDLVSSIFFKF